jgi:choline dehydrogenase-like flavoprotein
MKSTYKALVIGTGLGGAVAACRLAQASLHVGVLERGKDYRTTRFPHNDGDTGAVVFAGGGAPRVRAGRSTSRPR